MSIRVAIVGGGFIGLKHAEAIHEVNGLEVVSVVSRTQGSVDRFRETFPVRGDTDHRNVIEDCDAVLVATPHHLHTDIALDALAAGKHLMLEKPMALTLPECDSINRAAAKQGVKMMVGFTYHFAPHYLVAKSLIDSGELGSPVAAVSTVSKPWWVPNRTDWHLDRATGGGMWLVAGIHGLDRMNWLLGEDPESVSASLGTHFHDIAADDAGIAHYRYRSGLMGAVVSMGYREGAVTHSTDMYLTEARLVVDDRDGVRVGRGGEWTDVPYDDSRVWVDLAFVNQWTAFRDAIVDDTEIHPSGTEARATMAALFAAEASAADGGEVTIGGPLPATDRRM